MPDIRKPEAESRLDLLRRKLYNRETTGVLPRRSKLLPENYDQPHGWGVTPAVMATTGKQSPRKVGRTLSTLLIIALTFFLVSLLAAGIIFWRGLNVISGGNIGLAVQGPVSIKSGEETSLQIIIENRNQTALRSVDLVLEYPAGTRSSNNPRELLLRSNQAVGDINPGETVNRTVKAVLFGGEGSKQEVKVTMDYRIPGSEAIFEKKSSYPITISSSPLSITADLPSEILPGQELILKLKTVSNSEALLRGVLLSVAYPAGFEFKSANIKPAYGNNVWALGDIEAGDERELTITGSLVGASDDARAFRATAGSQDEESAGKILVTYGELFKTVTLKKPYLETVLTLNKEDTSEYVISAGQVVRGEIAVVNNLATSITDVSVKLALMGEVLDKTSVAGDQGFYDSLSNIITWDKTTEPSLAALAPGDKGRYAFAFATQKLSSRLVRDPKIELKLVVAGNRTEEGFIGRPTETIINKSAKILSALQLATRALYRSGPFENSGPVPPVAEQTTTYTTSWTISNSSSDMKAVEVRARLPQYVKWLGAYVPTSEIVSYNSATREVVWSPGHVPAGTGNGLPSREVSFQIGLTPSVSQQDQSPNLLEDIRVTGIDSFTGVKISEIKPSPTTETSSEDGYKQGDGKVAAP